MGRKSNVWGESQTLQVMHPDLTLGLLALAFLDALPSPSADGRRYNSMGVSSDTEGSC